VEHDFAHGVRDVRLLEIGTPAIGPVRADRRERTTEADVGAGDFGTAFHTSPQGIE